MTYEEALEELAETFNLRTGSVENFLVEEGLDFLSYEDEVNPEELEEMYRAIESCQC